MRANMINLKKIAARNCNPIFFPVQKINELQASNKSVNYTQMPSSKEDVILAFANHYRLTEVL